MANNREELSNVYQIESAKWGAVALEKSLNLRPLPVTAMPPPGAVVLEN